MKITNQQLLELENSLSYLSQKETNIWYNIAKNIIEIKPFISNINDFRKAILDKYASIEEDNTYNFGGNKEKSDNDWNKYLKEEIEVDLIKIDIEKLKDLKLNANTMLGIIHIS